MENQEIKQLEKWARSILKDDFDLFDLRSEIDRKVSLEENKTILREKFKVFLQELKPTRNEIKTHQEMVMYEQQKQFKEQEEIAEKEFNNALTKISESETSSELEKHYFIPKQYVKMVGREHVRGLLLYGPCGLGKSYLVKKALIEEKINFEIIKGHITSLQLYKFLYENRNKIILLDDLNILDNEINFNMLKACLSDDERLVQYHTSSSKLDIPNKFYFEGRLIILQNLNPKSNPSMKAVESRILSYNLEFDYQTKIKIIFELAKQNYDGLSLEQRMNIAEWIKENTSEATENLNLRLLFLCFEFYKFDSEKWKELAKANFKTNRHIELIVMGMSESEWCEETGKSRRTYYNYKSKVMQYIK